MGSLVTDIKVNTHRLKRKLAVFISFLVINFYSFFGRKGAGQSDIHEVYKYIVIMSYCMGQKFS